MIDESLVTFMDEDIQGGYSQVHLVYPINQCLCIDVYARDYERGIEIINSVEDKLKDIDLSGDIAYNEKYDAKVDEHLKWKKEQEKEKKVAV